MNNPGAADGFFALLKSPPVFAGADASWELKIDTFFFRDGMPTGAAISISCFFSVLSVGGGVLNSDDFSLETSTGSNKLFYFGFSPVGMLGGADLLAVNMLIGSFPSVLTSSFSLKRSILTSNLSLLNLLNKFD